MTRFGLLLCFGLILLPIKAEIRKLQVEYLTNPIGLDVQSPRFSWQIDSKQRGVFQEAYAITVAKDSLFKQLVWESGKIISDQSVHVPYKGQALTPSTRYYWKVKAWNNRSGEESSNETAFFETGLLHEGWSDAEWIEAVETPKDSICPWFTLQTNVTITSGNASIIFGAQDSKNLFMWSINTLDHAQEPLLRRHIYIDGQLTASDTYFGKLFNKSDLLQKEITLKIEVHNRVIKTYINEQLIDSYVDSKKLLHKGRIGFRAFKGNHNETALYDQVILTQFYNKGNDIIGDTLLNCNFETSQNPFEGGEIINVQGNQKLAIASTNGDFKVLEPSQKSIPLFRKDFKLRKKIAAARIYSSALGVYDLFINGVRVGTPQPDGNYVYDEMKPEWTDYRKTAQYHTYDVTPLLHKGNNVIGAQVSSGWFMGGVSHGEYGQHPLAFLAKLKIIYTDGSSEIIVTDTSWKSSTNGPILLGDIYDGETYDARRESNWSNPTYSCKHWNDTRPNHFFKGKLIGFAGPKVQVRPELCRVPVSITTYAGSTNRKINVVSVSKGNQKIHLKCGETAIYNLGQNMVGWVHFKVKGSEGTQMKIRFGEMLNDTGNPQRGDDGPAGSLYTANLRTAKATQRYILKGEKNGESYHPSTTFFGFQYCEITADKDIEIQWLKGEVVSSNNAENSSFTTSHPLINQLYHNILWGQRGNYLSIPTDCPQRDERLGWTGDTQVFCRAATYNANVSAFFEKWMRDMRDGQRIDGAFPSVAPQAWGVASGQAAWSDAGIIVPWTIYLVYGNKGILANNYTSMERYMEFLKNQQGDGYKYNGAGISFGDWLAYEPTENRYISVCYYAYTALLMEKISTALSQESGDKYWFKALHYRNLYNDIRTEFQQRYVQTDGSLKQTSQTAYLLALKLNLFPTEEASRQGKQTLVKKITDNKNLLSTGFVGTAILNQTLSMYQSTDKAYDLLLQRNNPSWMYSIDQGATTIWERWDSYTKEKGFNTVSMNSFNHYSYGAVLEWMYSIMAGIDVDEQCPGYKHIILHPEPDMRDTLPDGQERIQWVKASFESNYGKIKSEWTRKNNGDISYRIHIPANTTATLTLPLPSLDYKVSEKGIDAVKSEGVQSVTYTQKKAVLKLESGEYEFNVSSNNTF